MSRYRFFMNKLSILPIAIVGLGIMTLPAPAQAIIEFDQNVTPDVIFGTGNANGSFTTDRSNGVELGLRGKLRHNGAGNPENTFNSNGDSTYSFQAIVAPTQAFPTAEWSFEWTVNTDWTDSTPTVLADLTYVLGLDADPSLGTSYTTFDPISTGYADHAIGDNLTANGGGTVAIDGPDYLALIGANNIAQNSWKPHWFFPGFDPNVEGTYSIYLEAWDGANLVARTEIQILTGNAHPVLPPVVNPISYDMPNGGTGTYEYHDETYSGLGDNTVDCAALTDGLGDLTDDFIANTDLLNQATSDPYVGWRNNVAACTNPTITFNFAAATAFNSVTVYAFDRNGRGGVGVPTSASVQVTGNAVRNFPLVDPLGEGQIAYTLDLSGDIGDEVAVTLNHSTQWLFISEVVFSGNTLPVANDDPGIPADFTTDEDTSTSTGNVLDNDTDDDGDSLSVSEVNGSAGDIGSQIALASGALLTLNSDGTMDYDPNGQFEDLADGESTTDTFAYTVSDGNGGTDTATVTMTITGVNDLPTAVNDPGGLSLAANFTTDEDNSFTTADVTLNDTDPDTSDTLSACSLDTTGTVGNVTVNGGGSNKYDYDPNGQFEWLADGESTTDTFTYKVDDGQGDGCVSNAATVTITITGVNDLPTAVNDPGGLSLAANFTTDEDSSFTTADVTLNDTDPDTSDTLSACGLDTAGTVGNVTVNGGDSNKYDYDPNGQFEWLAVGESTTDTFTYKVDDGQGDGCVSNAATVTITITGVNDLPTAVNDPGGLSLAANFTTDEDNSFTTADVTLNDTDPDTTDTLSACGLDTILTVGNVTVNGVDSNKYDYDPNGQFEWLGTGISTTDTFTYKVDDGQGDDCISNAATVTITITGVNDAPVVISVEDDVGSTFGAQFADYSDFIGKVVVTATDVDSPTHGGADDLALTTTPASLPSDISTSATGCSDSGYGQSCTWDMDGQVLVPGDNIYNIDFIATDDEGASSTCTADPGVCSHDLTVQPEDATVELDVDNPTAEQVDAPDGEKTGVELFYTAWEMNLSPYGSEYDDDPNDGSPTYGNLNEAEVYMDLVPVGPGGKISGVCVKESPLPMYPSELYAQILVVKCTFATVPVNVYEIDAYVDGDNGVTDRFYAGAAEGLYSVYDPSLGFTTGGGWFYWPDTCSKDYFEVEGGVANGGFESPSICPAGFLTYGAGSGDLTDWVIGGNSIDHICSHWMPAKGDQSLDMSGNGAASITQELTGLVVDQPYKVSFMLAGNPDDRSPTNAVKTIEVDVGDSSDTIEFNVMTDCGGPCTRSDMGWTMVELMFTATAESMDLSFSSQTDNAWGPALDDVKLFTEECNGDYPGDKTNFGFNMKYNKKQTNLQGSLLVMRHTITGETYKVKSNSLDKTLAIGEGADEYSAYDWAAFSGKSTFREPGEDNSGNNPFLVYVEDHGEQGCNQDPVDEFWIEVTNGETGDVVFEVNGPLSDPAGITGLDGDDEPIECGNIYVPHKGKGGGGGGKPSD